MSDTFSNQFETGHSHIDTHHKDLFSLIHLLDEAVESHNPEKLDKVITFLETHVTEHFDEEEALMKTHDYAEYDIHAIEHAKMRTRMQELRKRYDEHDSKTHLIFDLRRFIDRMVRHIQTIDVGIAHLENS